jgi:hypothetical protein
MIVEVRGFGGVWVVFGGEAWGFLGVHMVFVAVITANTLIISNICAGYFAMIVARCAHRIGVAALFGVVWVVFGGEVFRTRIEMWRRWVV